VRKVEHLGTDGQTHKGEIVIARIQEDAITIAMYAADSSGSRNAEPVSKLTYQRQQTQGLPKATPASAVAETSGRSPGYERLGDLVASGGYEWLIGKWSGQEKNQTCELEYRPILDKHAASVDRKSGDFEYFGLIMYAASRREVVEFGADTLGRIWKTVWEQAGGDLVNKSELTKPDGTTQELRQVFAKIDNDTFQVKRYGVGADGNRASQPREQVTFKREKQPPRPI